MNSRFELKFKDPTKESELLYKCHLNGIRFIYGVGLKIYPKLSDATIQRPTFSKATIKKYKNDIPNIETRITNLKTRIENICNAFEAFVSNCQLNNIEINMTELGLYLDEKVMQSKKTVGDQKKPSKKEFNSEAGQDLQIQWGGSENFKICGPWSKGTFTGFKSIKELILGKD